VIGEHRRSSPTLVSIVVMLGAVAGACAGPLAGTPWAPLGCPRSPTHEDERGASGYDVKLEVSNTASDAWEPIDMCILVDGRAVRQKTVTDLVSALASHQVVDTSILVARGSTHAISIGILYRAKGAVDGIQIQFSAGQTIEPLRLGDHPVLSLKVSEQGNDFTPVAMRFRGEWSFAVTPQ